MRQRCRDPSGFCSGQSLVVNYGKASPYALVASGTSCSVSVTCSNIIKEGVYSFRVSGLAAGNEYWQFCHTSGVVGEELVFKYYDGICTPLNKYSARDICFWEKDTRHFVPISEDSMGSVGEGADIAGSSNQSMALLLDYILVCSILFCCLLFAISKFFSRLEYKMLPDLEIDF